MRTLKSILVFMVVLFTASFSCAQNGPTPPSVKLSWTQSTAPGVTANCVYRGTTAGVYALPALFCSTLPITTYLDSTVARGTTYHYAVTAQVAAQESNYSNDAIAIVPAAITPPVLNGNPVETKLVPPGPQVENLVAVVRQ